MTTIRIVITGGPCAGKTSAMDVLRKELAERSLEVVLVPEAATDLILEGTAPWTCASMLEFQTQVMTLQVEREDTAQGHFSKTPTVILFDRGICDSRAYLSEDDYQTALAANNLTEQAALARYDAVFCLESIAKTDPASYTHANNSARFEDADEAVQADDRVIAAWQKHPNIHFISNANTFEEKARSLVQSVLTEIERRL